MKKLIIILLLQPLLCIAAEEQDFICEVRAAQKVSATGVIEESNFSGFAEAFLNKTFAVDRKTGIIVGAQSFKNNNPGNLAVHDEAFNSYTVISSIGAGVHSILQIGFWSGDDYGINEGELPFVLIQTNVILSGICSH
jgi:hypothetical protein